MEVSENDKALISNQLDFIAKQLTIHGSWSIAFVAQYTPQAFRDEFESRASERGLLAVWTVGDACGCNQVWVTEKI